MLHLYVIDPCDAFDEGLPASALRPSAYLEQRPSWVPFIEDTWLVLDAPGGEALLQLNPFGRLDLLIPQLEEAAARLETKQLAIIRSAGDWTPSFLVLEPEGEVTRLSVLTKLPSPLAYYYPLHDSPYFTIDSIDQHEVLYAYIHQHRDSLRPGPLDSLAVRALQRVELSTLELVQGLREEASAGKELCELLFH